jgi:hypothetical protein
MNKQVWGIEKGQRNLHVGLCALLKHVISKHKLKYTNINKENVITVFFCS